MILQFFACALLSLTVGAFGAISPRGSATGQTCNFGCPAVDRSSNAIAASSLTGDTLSCTYKLQVCLYTASTGHENPSNPNICPFATVFQVVCPPSVYTIPLQFASINAASYNCVYQNPNNNIQCVYDVNGNYINGPSSPPCPANAGTCTMPYFRRKVEDNFTALQRKKRRRALDPAPSTPRPNSFVPRRALARRR